MKMLSIRQPWAWAIVELGKDIEKRDWNRPNPALNFRGGFLLHTGQGMTRDEYESFCDFVYGARLAGGKTIPAYADLPRGGIVGRATVTAVVTASSSPWFFGPVGLCLAKVERLPFTPCKGALGFVDVPADVFGELRGHLDG